jgi:hypothetical protein
MPEPEPTIDLTVIHFPSDKATLAELRKAYPRDFENFGPSRYPGGDIERMANLHDGDFAAMFDWERIYADAVFRNAVGIPNPGGTVVPHRAVLDGIADTLVGEYVRVGWAGEHQAEEMVRGIEQQALAQAQKFVGRVGP